MLIKILIIFFSFLIIYQIYEYLNYTKEGFTEEEQKEQDKKKEEELKNQAYQSYNESPEILANKNASNIEILKSDVDNFKKYEPVIDELQNKVNKLQDQVDSIAEANIPETLDVDAVKDMNEDSLDM
jgi:hypothetical protein